MEEIGSMLSHDTNPGRAEAWNEGDDWAFSVIDEVRRGPTTIGDRRGPMVRREGMGGSGAENHARYSESHT